MSRTYKYPKENSDDTITKEEYEIFLRIRKRLERRKKLSKKRVRLVRSYKKHINLGDIQRTRE